MKKPRFGGEGSSREDWEREAQAELERLTRQAGGPRGGGGAASFSPPRPRPRPRPMPSKPAPEESRSPGFGGGRVSEEPWDADEHGLEDEDEEGFEGPRSAAEEEELVTELALRDWAESRGRAGRIEDYARPRLDPTSVEAQRDRALSEILERQQRLQREYRERVAHLQSVDDGGDEPPAAVGAHQMNVLRRGKPPGMMNMAAAQTGSMIRQRNERMSANAARASADAAAAETAKAEKAAARKAAKAAKAGAAKKVTAKKVTAKKAAVPRKASAADKAPAAARKAAAAKPAGVSDAVATVKRAAAEKVGTARKAAAEKLGRAPKAAPAAKKASGPRAATASKKAPTPRDAPSEEPATQAVLTPEQRAREVAKRAKAAREARQAARAEAASARRSAPSGKSPRRP